MNVSAIFVLRPIGTTLLALGMCLVGILAFWRLPVSNLPSVDFPTIFISTGYPGANAEIMAASVAAPIERRVGEIAGVRSIVSKSALGSTLIFVSFELGRDIDHAARDVQAALNAAATDLPTGLPNLPTFRKANPDDTPILILALTSDRLKPSAVYDAADTVLLQRLSQVEGVASVSVDGADQPAVRVTADPQQLAAMGLSMDDVRSAVANANALAPSGAIDGPQIGRAISVNSQLKSLDDYRTLVVKIAGTTPVLLRDVATVEDGKRNVMQEGSFDGKPSVLVSVTKAPGANVVDTVARITALMPQLSPFLPAGLDIAVLHDRTVTIRASVDDMIATLVVAIGLVVLVVMVFLRNRAAIVAAGVTVPLALAGTCALMLAVGFSIDNISLMALATSVGFVVDDAVVMIENIERARERGLGPLEAALEGSRQVWFTLLSISVSLMAAFIPLLFLGGILGRFFREFSVTLAFSVAVSTVASLTVTPMVCAHLREARSSSLLQRLAAGIERALDGCRDLYARSLRLSLSHGRIVLALFAVTVGLAGWLYVTIPKGSFPKLDTDLLLGSTMVAPTSSYAVLSALQRQVAAAVREDPAVAHVGSTIGSSGGRTSPANQGRLFIALKPKAQRGGLSSDAVIARLRTRLRPIVGITTSISGLQELQSGGTAAKLPSLLTLTDSDYGELLERYQPILDRLRQIPSIVDVADDHGASGLQADLTIDRTTASRLGVTVASFDNALNNSFSQRFISTIYSPRNQYRVVLTAPYADQQGPSDIMTSYVPAGVTPLASSGLGGGTVSAGLSAASQLQASQRSGYQAQATALIQVSALARERTGLTPLSINHKDQYPEITFYYAVKAGVSEAVAGAQVREALAAMHLPAGLHVDLGGGEAGEKDDGSQAFLILVAVVAIYLVLGILYESLVHPLTILSTLPSAGLGALLALKLTGADLDRIAFVGIILTISIVKKNGIMMVDFALEDRRGRGSSAADAIARAAVDRFRPILMTTMASVLGAIPLIVAGGTGAELRRPLGLTIVGGLLLAQVLTLYSTPAIFIAIERLRGRLSGARTRGL